VPKRFKKNKPMMAGKKGLASSKILFINLNELFFIR